MLRAAELSCERVYPMITPSDELLFKVPSPSKEDCPICLMPMPLNELHCTYSPCCGKFICHGCMHQKIMVAASSKGSKSLIGKCSFCREPTFVSDKEIIARCKKRMAVGDGDAFCFLGMNYYDGLLGLQPNYTKAAELWLGGASLGSVPAYNHIAIAYSKGLGVEKNEKKAFHFNQLAAMGGDVTSRFNLGVQCARIRMEDTIEHWKIAAGAGFELALDKIEMLLECKALTEEAYESVLTAYLTSRDEMNSDQREMAEKNKRGRSKPPKPPVQTAALSSCSVCGKKTPDAELTNCNRCKTNEYMVCSNECKRNDWKRHKAEDCVDEWWRPKHCGCKRCKEGLNESGVGDDKVSDFFNDNVSMLRGRIDSLKKYTENGVEPLTEEELNMIAYPYPRITFFMYKYTFHAPDGKAFTVRQLAEAFAEAEGHNKDSRYCYFEGLHRHPDPHTFQSMWGS